MKDDLTRCKPFTLPELLKVLCQHFVTIPAIEQEPLDLFVRQADAMLNIQDTFVQIVLNFGGAPSAMDYFVEIVILDKPTVVEAALALDRVCFYRSITLDPESALIFAKRCQEMNATNQGVRCRAFRTPFGRALGRINAVEARDQEAGAEAYEKFLMECSRRVDGAVRWPGVGCGLWRCDYPGVEDQPV